MSVVKPLWAGARGIDCDTKLTAVNAAALKQSGVDFVMRYLPLANNPHGNDLDAAETAIILAAGLGLGAVQHTRRAATFTPNAYVGDLDGLAMTAGAHGAALPTGMHLFYDMEGPSAQTTAANCAAYDAAWCAVVARAGFICGGYFGDDLPLNGGQLYLLKVKLYWKSGSQVAEPAICGWAMRQQTPLDQRLDGLGVDLDAVTVDALRRFPLCLFADDGAVA
jgi:Domain of unknown function (DUF1906)